MRTKQIIFLMAFCMFTIFCLPPAFARNTSENRTKINAALPIAPEQNEIKKTAELPKAPEEKEIEIDRRQQARIRLARQSLARLKRSIKRYDFFSQRIALNVWRSNAIDAGNFDEALYKKMKIEIYQASIEKNLKWFEAYIQQKYYYEANICLKLWRLQTKEIDTFDEKKYKSLKKQIK